MQAPNPYAAPIADNVARPAYTGDGVWRDGDAAVCHKEAPWPDRCVKCNAPALGYRLQRRLYWHPQWVWFIVLVSPLVYVIVALVVRKSAKLHVGLCAEHRSRRRTGMLVGWVGLLATLGTCTVGVNYESGATIGVSVLALVAAVIVALVLGRVVQPKKIDDVYAWVKCGRPFVDSLPAPDPARQQW